MCPELIHPEMDPNKSQINISRIDQALDMAPAILGERYTGHNQYILEGLAEHGVDTPSMRMAVAFHDVCGQLYSSDQQLVAQAEQRLTEFYNSDKQEWPTTLWGLHYALNAQVLEDYVAEKWRGQALDKIMSLPDDVSVRERHIIERSIAKEGLDIQADQPEIITALRKGKFLEPDIKQLSEATDDIDRESLILKGLEMKHNLENPAPDMGAYYRDCVEAYNCYSPLLDLCGFEELAAELKGLALEFFYDDSVDSDPGAIGAKSWEQVEASERHFDEIKVVWNNVISNIDNHLSDEGLPTLNGAFSKKARTKTLGSTMEKFTDDEDFQNLELISDGVGFRLSIDDDAIAAGHIITIAKIVKQQLISAGEVNGYSIKAAHPNPAIPSDRDYITKPREGYSAYNISFMCEIGGEIIPFEVQLMTKGQEKKHKYYKASPLYYKLGVERTEESLVFLSRFEQRADYIKSNADLPPTTRPSGWVELLRRLPELETPLHDVYSLSSVDGEQVLGPIELAALGFDYQTKDTAEKVFLSTSRLTEQQFTDCLGILDASLANNPKVKEAIEFMKEKLANHPPRHNGYTILEGHLFPAALQAAVLAVVSGRRWDNLEDPDFMQNEVIFAVAHDSLEDTGATPEEIEYRFGSKILNLIKGISKAPKDKLTEARLGKTNAKLFRRKLYSRWLEFHPEVLFVKLVDRQGNHGSDNARILRGQVKGGDRTMIEDYHVESDEDLMPLFKRHLPRTYLKSIEVDRKIYERIRELAI